MRLTFQQSIIAVAMRKLYQPDDFITPQLPAAYLQDYIIALVLNEAGDAMVWERQKPGGGAYWQIMERYLQANEDPFTAVQQELLAQTGCQTGQWAYLGSHVIDTSQPVGVGYFFCAQQACKIAPVAQEQQASDGELLCLKWVSVTDLRYALLDGRLAMTSHALTVSLALLTILK